jgi:multiple sugar transport system permease protein
MKGIGKPVRIMFKHVVLGLAMLVGLLPFFLVVLTSVKLPRQAMTMPPVWLFKPTLSNYADLFVEVGFVRTIMNSMIIAGGATLLTTFIGVLAGYAFSRFRFRGSGVVSYSILFLRVVPPVSFVIPYFLLWRRLHLQDTYLAMILMYTAISLPILVWMMRSFFRDVPIEIEESALVDGCTRWQALRKVLVPAVAPGIFASSTLAFITIWNEFMYALYNTGKHTRTLPVEIYNSLGYYQLDWARLSSSAVIAIIPAVLFIALTQKYIVRGLTMGAVKG